MLHCKSFTVNPLGVNCYVVHDDATSEAAVIDPGMFFDAEREELTHYIERSHLHVSHILLTHGHFDHVMSTAWCAGHYGLTPQMHEADIPLAEHAREQILQFMHRSFPMTPITSATAIADGETVSVGTVELRVIHTPGHTPGGVCFYCADSRVLFSGDTIFQGSVGRTDFDGSSTAALIDSIRTRIVTLPDDTVILPGHGPSTTVSDERRYNPFI